MYTKFQFTSVPSVHAPCSILTRVCHVQGLSCPGYVCPGFVCPGFVGVSHHYIQKVSFFTKNNTKNITEQVFSLHSKHYKSMRSCATVSLFFCNFANVNGSTQFLNITKVCALVPQSLYSFAILRM
jgi:hypothetical protein